MEENEGAVAYPDDGAKCRQWRIRMAGAHCALGLLVLFGPRHRPLGASHSEEKDSAKKNRNHPGRSRQGATLQVDDHHLRTETNELPTESEGAKGARKEKRPCSG